MMVIDCKFELGSVVYLKTDREQQPRIVCELLLNKNGIQYKLQQGSGGSWHYDFEISIEKDVLAATTN